MSAVTTTVLGLPWVLWTAACLVAAAVYVRVWPRPAGPRHADARTPWRRLVLRWFHPLVWLLLALSFPARVYAGREAGDGTALAGLFVYALFLVQLLKDRAALKRLT